MADALVHDAEAEAVARGRGAIARERRDTLHRARLGLHSALGGRAAHTFAERSVLPRDGQGGEEVLVELLLTVDVAEEVAEQLRREVVVEREARTVGSAASSYGFGVVSENIGWGGTAGVWVGLCGAALLLTLASAKKWRSYFKNERV